MQKQVKQLDFQLNQNKFVRFTDPVPKSSNSYFRALSISIFGNHNQVQYIKSMMKLTLLSNIEKNNKKKYKDNPFPIVSENSTLLKKYDTNDKMMFWEYWQNSDRQCFQKDNYQLASYTFNKKISVFSLSQDGYLNQLMISSCRKKTGQKIFLAKVGKKYFSVEKQANLSLSGYIKDYFFKSIISKIVDEERSLKEIQRQRDLIYPLYDEVVMNSHKKFPQRAHKKSLSQCGDIMNKLQTNQLELSQNYHEQNILEMSNTNNKLDQIQNRSQKNESSRKNIKINSKDKSISPEKIILIKKQKEKEKQKQKENNNDNSQIQKCEQMSENQINKNQEQRQQSMNNDSGKSSNSPIQKLEQRSSPTKSLMSSSSNSKNINTSSKSSSKSKNTILQKQKLEQKYETNRVTFGENIQAIQIQQRDKFQNKQSSNLTHIQEKTIAPNNSLELSQQNVPINNQNHINQSAMINNPYGYTQQQYAMYGGYPMQMPINNMAIGMQPMPQYYQNQYDYMQQMQAMYPSYYQQMYQEQYYVQPQQLVPNNRYRGRLKFFQINNKYGFIVVDGVNIDLFVHYDDLSKAGITKQKLQGHNNRQMRFQFTYYQYDGKNKKSKKAIDLVLLSEG